MWGPSEKLPENAELPTPRQELHGRPSLRPVHTSFLWDSDGEMGGGRTPGEAGSWARHRDQRPAGPAGGPPGARGAGRPQEIISAWVLLSVLA